MLMDFEYMLKITTKIKAGLQRNFVLFSSAGREAKGKKYSLQ